ncbi:MAG TPA: hypothetical protein VGM63_24935 [Mucilaginibacter sp.]|jgi:hypothetical protein
MSTIEELNRRKVPVVIIDEALDKYNDVILFPEKLAKANKMLHTVGLPKSSKKKTRHA